MRDVVIKNVQLLNKSIDRKQIMNMFVKNIPDNFFPLKKSASVLFRKGKSFLKFRSRTRYVDVI